MKTNTLKYKFKTCNMLLFLMLIFSKELKRDSQEGLLYHHSLTTKYESPFQECFSPFSTCENINTYYASSFAYRPFLL